MTFSLKTQTIKTIFAIIFIISGISGLIYQIVWFKYLSLFLGNTTYAQMTVLAAFLGGLALGNYFLGKRADAISNLVKVYALLEIFIGAYCLSYPALSFLVGNSFLQIASQLNISSQNILFSVLRFFLAAILLLLPTIAMGGTLPVLSKYFVSNLKGSGKDISLLYFLNSFGAVIGVLFAGFILIKEFGLANTCYAAAILNILIGIFGFVLSFISENMFPKSGQLIIETADSASIKFPGTIITKIILLVSFFSGMAALLYEMVWTRLLINFFGSSTYSFSIMLAAFILGITIGSWIIYQAQLTKFNKIKILTYSQAAIGLTTMAVLLFYERLPYTLWKVSALFSKTPQSFEIFLFVEFLICVALILLPTIFMGISLPAAAEAYSIGKNGIGSAVGKIFSVNTIGTVIGVIITGLVFIPYFGIKKTFEIGIAINVLSSIILLWSYNLFRIRTKFVFSILCLCSFFIYIVMFSNWNRSVISSGVFTSFNSSPPKTYEDFLKSASNDKIIFYEEGVNATVAVTQSISDSTQKSLIINGKPDASTSFDMSTQVLLGQIPLMLHQDPKTVFVVGFGSGTTIGSVLTHPVEKVICAEISKEVINAATLFNKENYNCIHDKRLSLVNEDALTLLKLSKDKYDVIISEPSNPWIAGIGTLFSKEYFQKCIERMNESGIMVQWFHVYDTDDSVVQLVLNTFSSVFPYAQIWNSVSNDIILVGSKKNIQLNINSLESKFASDKINNDFKRIFIPDLFTFLSCQSCSPRGFFTISEMSPLNTETHPILEFLAPRSFYVGKQSSYIYKYDEKFDTLSNSLLVKDFLKNHLVQKNEIINAIKYNLKFSNNFRYCFGLARYLREKYPDDYESNYYYAVSLEKFSILNQVTPVLERISLLYPDSIKNKIEYYNALILEKINATTFIKSNPINNEVNFIISASSMDSVTVIKVLSKFATVYRKNSDYINAQYLCDRIEQYTLNNKNLLKYINLEEFFFTGALANLYQRNFEKVYSYYIALMNSHCTTDNLFRMRRLLAWWVKINNSGNRDARN
jgi:spermidine synthase